MKLPQFHLSIGVESTDDEATFFENVLKAKVTHRDASGYINVDFHGCQITLQIGGRGQEMGSHFHFGANLELEQFEQLSRHALQTAPDRVLKAPETWDEGTALERRKMYLKSPSGYVLELKGYRQARD